MDMPASSIHLLDERIQRFIWTEGWQSLRDAQEAAIPLILGADRDVIIAAATAAGKTEAAFFPALTHLVRATSPGLIVYISPLKALINDQFGRLQRLCEQLEVPVWPWHGDVSSSLKARFYKSPAGVLLITPESIESTLCNRGSSVAATFMATTFFVVDELHAFIGSERGKQLQSLMHRIQAVVRRRIPRVGLSATLGDMGLAAEFMRPGGGASVAMVISQSTSQVNVQLKGYVEQPASIANEEGENLASKTQAEIAQDLFKALRGSNNLVFPNSRKLVERYTVLLNKLCAGERIPNEFWPHHGSLSKDIRAETEAALKQQVRPATAVCTNTLELGIDVGAVKCVVQIGPPPSVASLRQRLGRSGRREGEPAVLRAVCVEESLDGAPELATKLRLGTVQSMASISLLAERWFEPPRAHGAHLSTLVQQVLSAVAQCGGATTAQLYELLCTNDGAFVGVSKPEFVSLIQELGSKDLLVRDASGVLLHGKVGERLVNHFSFYPAFATVEEYSVVTEGKTLGSVPADLMLSAGAKIVFAGKSWLVKHVDLRRKTIIVTPSTGGEAPQFDGSGARAHIKVRKRMRELLEGSDVPRYLDTRAKQFLEEGRRNYVAMDLANVEILDQGEVAVLLTWLGDDANQALAQLLRIRGLSAKVYGPMLLVMREGLEAQVLVGALRDAIAGIACARPPTIDLLLAGSRTLAREKWDWALPESLLRKSYASLNLDIDGAVGWCVASTQLIQRRLQLPPPIEVRLPDAARQTFNDGADDAHWRHRQWAPMPIESPCRQSTEPFRKPQEQQ